MTDMIERMTHVLMCAGITRDSGESIRLYRPDECAALASRVFLAALDSRDGALEVVLARAIRRFTPDPDCADDVARARAAIAALQEEISQGVSNP